MKQRWVLLLLATCGWSGYVWAQNLLSNGGLETGDRTGWTDARFDVFSTGWYQGAGPRTGSYAGGTASNWNVNSVTLEQTVSVSSSQTYRASGWFWLFCNSGHCSFTRVSTSVVWQTAAGTPLSTVTTGERDASSMPQQQYFELAGSWTAPANAARARVLFRMTVDARSGGGWAVCAGDDFSFSSTSPVPTSTPAPQQRRFWMLTYARQYGRAVAGVTDPLAEPLTFYENGSPAVGMGITSSAYPNQAYWGETDVRGKRRIDLRGAEHISPMDVRVFDPLGIGSTPSPAIYWRPPLPTTMYHFEFLYTRVPDYERYVAYPNRPVYHYDLVNGFNTATTEAPGLDSDAFSLDEWGGMHEQSFVVPEGINRIIACKVHNVGGPVDPFTAVFAILDRNRNQIGPTRTAPQKSIYDFKGWFICWALEDVPVTPGEQYFLRSSCPTGQNVYATNSDRYPSGHLWTDGRPVHGRDMLAVVVGLYSANAAQTVTPTPTRSPSPTPTRTVAFGGISVH